MNKNGSSEGNSINKHPDYYYENGHCVFTSHFLLKRGVCCGNGCRHCPYLPKHQQGNKTVQPEFVQKL